MDEKLLSVVKVIRPMLGELLEPERARQTDARLAGLIARASAGQNVEAEIIDVLAGDDRLRGTAAALLTEGHESSSRAVYPAGYGEIVDAERFVCPHGDMEWYRLDVGDEVPECPDHGPLVRG